MTNAPRAVVGVVVAGAAFAGFAALSQVGYADARRFDRLDGRAENVDEPAPFPARLERSFDLDLEAGQVALIPYDEDARALVRR